MINLKKFKRRQYEELNDYEKKISSEGGVFLKSDDGQDWYQAQNHYSHNTMKVMYNDEGVIISCSKDVSMFFPENYSVAEVKDFPDGLNDSQCWVFDGTKIKLRVYTDKEKVERNEHIKKDLLKSAGDVIAPLQDAVDLAIASDTEKTALLAWKRYRVFLQRVDTTCLEELSWPEIPSKI